MLKILTGYHDASKPIKTTVIITKKISNTFTDTGYDSTIKLPLPILIKPNLYCKKENPNPKKSPSNNPDKIVSIDFLKKIDSILFFVTPKLLKVKMSFRLSIINIVNEPIILNVDIIKIKSKHKIDEILKLLYFKSKIQKVFTTKKKINE